MSVVLIEETTNEHKCEQIRLVFDKRGKPEYPGKNLSEQSIELTKLTHLGGGGVLESILDHIGERRVL